MAVDLVIDVEDTPGALAQVATAITDAGVNIAAATFVGPGDRAEIHILVPQADGLAVLVLAVGGFTDWLDGYLARAWHQTSRLGQMLDPIADRLYILAVLTGLALREIVPWWLVAIVIGRDVMIASLVPLLKTRGFSSLPVHFLGKAATFSLLYAFPLVLLGSGEQGWIQLAWVLGWAFAIWGTALYWYAGGLYVAQTVKLVRTIPPINDRRRSGSASG